MKRALGLLIMIGLLLVLIAPVAAQAPVGPAAVGLFPDSPQYALHGPYWVGTREFVIGADTERPLAITVWYPALNTNLLPEEITYTYMPPLYRTASVPGHAIADAYFDGAGGPYPLIIASHGSHVTRYFANYLTEHLASYGFVVMSAQHSGNATGDTLYYSAEDSQGIGDNMVYRPEDIQREIDYAKELTAVTGQLPGMVDLEQVAVVGHSFGGYTALTAAGAQVNLQPLREWCPTIADNPAMGFDYYFACMSILNAEQRILALRGMEAQPDGTWPAFDVTGVDAIIPLAAFAQPFIAEGLSRVTVPALFIVGDLDVGYADSQSAYAAVSSTHKALVVLKNASHSLLQESCDALQKQLSYFMCFEEQVWNLDRAHDRIRHFTTAFLLDVLKGDAEAHAALAPDAVSFPGIEYQAQGF